MAYMPLSLKKKKKIKSAYDQNNILNNNLQGSEQDKMVLNEND